MSSPHVLVVEHDPAAASVVAEIARRLGATATTLDEGPQAIRYLTGQPPYHLNPFPSLVVVDLDLPEAEGLRLLEFMSTSLLMHVTPVVAVTRLGDAEEERMCLEMGVQAFFRKPTDPAELYNAISVLLRRPAPPDRRGSAGGGGGGTGPKA